MRQLLAVLALSWPWTASAPSHGRADSPVAWFEASVPRTTADCTAFRVGELQRAALAVESWAAEFAVGDASDQPQEVLNNVVRVIEANQRVDAAMEEALSLRTRFAGLPEDTARGELLQNYLRAMSQAIDLSGRLRHLTSDAVASAADRLDQSPQTFESLFDFLIQNRVSIGAAVLSFVLFDPPPDWGMAPLPLAVKRKALRLIEATRQVDVLPDLAEFLRQKHSPPELVVEGAEVVRRIGLPQDPRPGQRAAAPQPTLLAGELRRILAGLDIPPANRSLSGRRTELLAWLDQRGRGILGETYRFGQLELRSGDWLLMRNPSPYNRFTDLSPGLFTHVGVVAAERGADGVRRFVIVDLPERGEHIPATNVDAYLQRTLHYFFLRHEDPEVGRRMGEAAISMVGNETQFDLTFRTDRVGELKNKPLAGSLIHTYCAGLLLICAQATGKPREEFFPIPENPAGGHLLANLSKLGISIGDRFVSPTGAVFSPHFQIVARREPLYSPGREVTEWVYDHFAKRMIEGDLQPSLGAYQLARQELAALSKSSPWLARALARAHHVSEHADLESAAKAAAVVETLDEIAEANVTDYAAAEQAILAGPVEQFAAQGLAAAQVEQIQRFRQRHQDLFQRWTRQRLSLHQLRGELVDYYKRLGAQQLEQRFFGGSP